MQLGTDQATLLVDGAGEPGIPGKFLFGIERRPESVFAHRHISDDDHGAAAPGNGPQTLQLLLLGKSQSSGRKDHPVFQFQSPVVHRGVQDVVHA